MMTQTKHKIFNGKIKMLLLILIWTSLIRHHCRAERSERQAKAKVLKLFNANPFEPDVVDAPNREIFRIRRSSRSTDGDDGAKRLFKGHWSNENEMAAWASNDVADSINSNATLNDNDSSSSCVNNGDSTEKQCVLSNVATAELINSSTDTPGAINVATADDADAFVSDIESDDYFPSAASDADNDTAAASKTIDSEIESATLLLQKLIYDFAIKYKQIPRVTYFTCDKTKNELIDNNRDSNNRSGATLHKINTIEILKRMYGSGSNIAAAAPKTTTTMGLGMHENNSILNKQMYNDRNLPFEALSAGRQQQPKGILIKVVQIDQFINKRRYNNNNSNHRSSAATGYGYERHERRNVGASSSGYGRNRPIGLGRYNSYAEANWLENALRSDLLRQIAVLDLSCGQTSRKLIEMASKKALFNSTYHWLLIEEDYAFNRQQQQKPSNANNNQWKKQDIILATNINTENVANRFVAANSMQQQWREYNGAHVAGNRQQPPYEPSNEPVDADAEHDMEIIEKFLEKINININTELILAKYRRPLRVGRGNARCDGAQTDGSGPFNKVLQRQSHYMLYDVWSPGLQYGGKLNISEIGNFSLDDGLQIAPWYLRSTTITRRMDMKNAHIRCLIVVTNKNRTDTLEHYLTTHYNTHLDSMNRFNYALLSHVRDIYNFRFILSQTSSWGYLKNGKFDGMIGALVRKQTDIGGSPIFFRIERAKVIDYTSRTWVARPCFIFRHPRGTRKDRIVFLQPFSNDVWISLAFCGFASIILLWVLSDIERKIGPKANNAMQRRSSENEVVPTSLSATSSPLQTKSFVMAGTGTTIESTAVLEKAKTTFYGQKQWQKLKHSTDGARVADAKQTAVVAGHDTLRSRRYSRRRRSRCCCRCPPRLLCGNIFCGQDDNDASVRRVGLFLESVLFYIGSICQQGLAYSTSFISGRCIVITSLFFSFAIYQFYSASIVGTLLMEKPKTIRTLRDLIHSSLEIGIEDIVYNRDYFLRTNDPDAIELYAKKVTSIPGTVEQPKDSEPTTTLSPAAQAKSYRDTLHSHERGAHAKTNDASNWYDPEYGVKKIKKGRFAFHVDVATAYKIISDTFTEKEICDLTEIQLFPPQKMVSIVQKGSPLRKIFTYGLRRVTEVGLMDYQRKIWHSPKPRCVKQIHTDDLRVDMQTFTSALLVLIFGYAVCLLALGLEIMHHKLWQRYTALE